MPLADDPELVRLRAEAAVMERARDYETYCRECLTIKDNRGRFIPLECLPAQIKLNRQIEAIRAKGKPVRIVALKARRVTVSTATAAKFFQEVPHNPGQDALVVAHTADATENIFEMYKTFQLTFRPMEGEHDARLGLEDLDGEMTQRRIKWVNSSKIQCKTAGSRQFGRSFNFRYLHLSEAAFYQDQATFLTGLVQAVPMDRDTMIVVESTANGIGDEFYKLCMQALEGQSDWELFFFAWWEHPLYQKPLTESLERFEQSLSGEEIEMRRLYALSPEQLNWRRWCIANNCRGSVATFKQEYPANPLEAFLGTGRPRFEHRTIERMPTSEGQRGRLEEDTYGPHRHIRFLSHEHGELTIFKRPDPHRTYLAGADVCEGTDVLEGDGGEPDSDFSVLYIADRNTGEQVAIWRAQNVHPAEFAMNASLVLRWYNWAQLVPEANGPGLAFIEKLMALSYPPSLVFHRNEAPDGDPRRLAPMIGFKTTTVTRPQLISTLDDALREGSITVYDAIAKQEMRTFVIKPNGKAEHQYGCHDDCVMAIALCTHGIQAMPASARKQITPYADAPRNYLEQRRKPQEPQRIQVTSRGLRPYR